MTTKLIPAADGGAGGEAPAAITRVPDSAFVSVRPARPVLVVRVRRGMPLRHGLMLTLAVALMALGGISAHKRPMHRAIVIPIPAGQGVVVT